MYQDLTDTTGALNGCVMQVDGFLRELTGMVGQDGPDIPVLELQFGEILTKTSVQTNGRNYLVITAFLPKCRRSHYMPLPRPESSGVPTGAMEFLWHADEGRYMGVRKVPITDLPDERSVMDAILATSDQAAAWFSSIRVSKRST